MFKLYLEVSHYLKSYLGFLSDIIGRKTILAWNIVVLCLSWTSFNFIPAYKESPHKVPFINYTTFNGSNAAAELVSIQWPICDHANVDNTSIETCLQSWLYSISQENVLVENITNYLPDLDPGLNIPVAKKSMIFQNLTSTRNGTFCTLLNVDLVTDHQNEFATSEIVDHPTIPGNCWQTFGNKNKTFWIVFMVFLLIRMHSENTWVVLDTITVSETTKHNSSYAMVLVWVLMGDALGPFISGLTIKDGDNGVNGTYLFQRKHFFKKDIFHLHTTFFQIILCPFLSLMGLCS